MEQPNLIPFAKQLRSNATEAEKLLWKHLRAKRFEGFKFKRQKPIGRYIVDFVCLEKRLVIEVDGGQHMDDETKDTSRTEWIEQQGYRVMRFWNNDVLSNIEGVLFVVEKELSA